VLIPVDVSQTVQDVLTNQEVVEFPTFQTLNSPPTNLPDGYILLSEYLVEFEKSYDEMKHLISSEVELTQESPSTMNHAEEIESRPMPNCNDILAILKRDTTG
jgi:hypothetical protein